MPALPMLDDEHDFKVVRSAVYLCRLAGERPSASKVIAAIKAVSGRGMRKSDVCARMKQLFALEGVTCGNRSGTNPEQTGTNPEPISSTQGTNPEQTGTNPEHHAQIRNPKLEIEMEKDIPPEPDGSVPPPEKPKAIKLEDELPEPVTFESEDEGRIKALLLERNPSGKMSLRVLRRFRAECKAKLLLVGTPCWRHGVDTALAKPAGWRYALEVMRNNPDGAPTRPAARGAPKERYVPENLRPNPEKLAFYDQLGKRSNAIRQGDAALGRQQNAGPEAA